LSGRVVHDHDLVVHSSRPTNPVSSNVRASLERFCETPVQRVRRELVLAALVRECRGRAWASHGLSAHLRRAAVESRAAAAAVSVVPKEHGRGSIARVRGRPAAGDGMAALQRAGARVRAIMDGVKPVRLLVALRRPPWRMAERLDRYVLAPPPRSSRRA
jgi:hypothetical protein